MSKCVITEQDHVEFINGVLHVNGQPKPSLQGCTFKGNVKFAIPIKEVAPAPAPAPQPPAVIQVYPSADPHHAAHDTHHVPAAPTSTAAPRAVESIGGLDELKEIMDVGKEIMDLPPWMGAVILVAFLFMKMKNSDGNKSAEKSKQPSTCKGHAAMEARLTHLESADLRNRVQKLEDDITKSLLESVRELRTPAPVHKDLKGDDEA